MGIVDQIVLDPSLKVKTKKLHKDSVIPSYAKAGDAGMDLTATSKEVDKYGNQSYGTGLAMEIPFGCVGLIFPRSSVSKYCLDLANAVGVIDSGYRGEIICKFKPTPQFSQPTNPENFNTDISLYNESYEVGDRVAQIMIIPIPQVQFKEVENLDETERGDGGFGSSGN